MSKPIFAIKAIDRGKTTLDSSDFCGLEKMLFLCEGACVYINYNIELSLGLFNSQSGSIVSIVYEDTSETQF